MDLKELVEECKDVWEDWKVNMKSIGQGDFTEEDFKRVIMEYIVQNHGGLPKGIMNYLQKEIYKKAV